MERGAAGGEGHRRTATTSAAISRRLAAPPAEQPSGSLNTRWSTRNAQRRRAAKFPTNSQQPATEPHPKLPERAAGGKASGVSTPGTEATGAETHRINRNSARSLRELRSTHRCTAASIPSNPIYPGSSRKEALPLSRGTGELMGERGPGGEGPQEQKPPHQP